MNTPPNAAALLPCPFCGGDGEVWEAGGGSMVVCRSPGCQTQCRLSGQRDKAIAAWNRRTGLTPSQDELVAENERLRKESEEWKKLETYWRKCWDNVPTSGETS